MSIPLAELLRTTSLPLQGISSFEDEPTYPTLDLEWLEWRSRLRGTQREFWATVLRIGAERDSVLFVFRERARLLYGLPGLWQRELERPPGCLPSPRPKYTSLERDLYGWLDELGEQYRVQVGIGRYRVDALVREHIVVEADGMYWHGPETEPYSRRRDEVLVSQGFVVVHLLEAEMTTMNASDLAWVIGDADDSW